MTTTNSSSFDPDVNEIIEEAFERCGSEARTGYHFRTARRSLNLLTIEWSNRGVNLFTIEEGSVALTEGTITYDLPNDTIDLLEHVIRTGTGTNQSDLSVTRISVSTYATIPNKNSTGRPVQIYIDRRSGATTPSGTLPPQVNLYPAPDNANTYTLVYWRLKRIDDVGNGTNTQAIPFRFYNCLIAGLAYYLSVKIPGAETRTAALKIEYDNQWTLAAEEDREKASITIVPTSSFAAR
jgi:hypothetical protein|tara:strand:- start:1016 stop:1729 length:714 start_codon:yes stop_codon:yes gene_type:complete